MEDTRKIRGSTFICAAIGLGLVSFLAASGLAYYLKPKAPGAPPPTPTGPDVSKELFKDWKKPDFAIILSGEQQGYLLPCGCSRPQVGGLSRRFNLFSKLRKAGWTLLPVDLGDIAQTTGPGHLTNVQGLLKYETSMRSLKLMGYQGVGIGYAEATFPLLESLAAFRLQDEPKPMPVISANLKEKEKNFASLVDSYHIATVPGAKVRVGISSAISPTTGAKITKQDATAKFAPNNVILPRLIQALKQSKTDLNILLYQGDLATAKLVAKAHQEFDVILCQSAESEPPSDPVKVGTTSIVMVGHKGRYVGALGVYRTGRKVKPFDFKYQLVKLSEDFLTAEGQKNPILDLIEGYSLKLKNQNYLSKFTQRPHRAQAIAAADKKKAPVFVGSGKCQKCHADEHKIWANSKHAVAYAALVNAKNPSNRQFDGECIVCHTVGFGHNSGFTDAVKTPNLKNVGCESCHGPGSEHVDNPVNAYWHKLMKPWPNKAAVDQMCQKCHDIDNDVHYDFRKRWKPVKH